MVDTISELQQPQNRTFADLAEAEHEAQKATAGYAPYLTGPEAWAHVKAAVDLYWEVARRSVESPWIDHSRHQGYLRRSLVCIAVVARRAAEEAVLWPEPWLNRVREGLDAARSAWIEPESWLNGRSTVASAHEGYGMLFRAMAHLSTSILDCGCEDAGFLLCMLAVIAQAIAEDLGLCALPPKEDPTR